MARLSNYSLVEFGVDGYYLHACVHDWALQALNMGVYQGENFACAVAPQADLPHRTIFDLKADRIKISGAHIWIAVEVFRFRGSCELKQLGKATVLFPHVVSLFDEVGPAFKNINLFVGFFFGVRILEFAR